MASSRAPLAPRNVDYQVTRRPRSVIPQYDKGQLVLTLRWFNNNCADNSTMVEPKITEEDLVRPTPDRIEKIYLMLLSVAFRCTKDSFHQGPFAKKNQSHPDLYCVFNSKINFIRCLGRFMEYCFLHGPENDFTFRDVADPTPKRTIRNLSAIVNYLKFMNQLDIESNGLQFMELTAEVDSKIQSALQKNSELQAQLAALKRKKEEERAHEEELRSAIRNQQQQLLATKQTQEHLETQLRNQQAEEQARRQQLDKVKDELAKHHARLEELRTMVVSSPDKLKEKLASVCKEHDTTCALLENAQNLATMWEGLCSKAQQVVPIVGSLQESIDMLTVRSEKSMELTSTLESSEQTIIRLKQDLKEAMSKHQNLHRRLNILKEEHEQLVSDMRRRPMGRNEGLQSEVQLGCNELATKKSQQIKLQQEIEEQKALLAESRLKYKKYTDRFSVLVADLNNAFITHQKRMGVKTP